MKRASLTLAIGVCLALPAASWGQEKPKVDQKRIDAAIAKGVAFLKSQDDFGVKKSRRDELVLLTLVHAGLAEADPVFQKLFKTITGTDLEKTYNVALQAMILEEIQRVKHQRRIQQCAQFLVDNQCENGQWSYGKPSIFVEDIPTGGPVRKSVSTGRKRSRSRLKRFNPSLPPGAPQKPKVVRKVKVDQRRQPTRSSGDNSNTQYAALGLRACHDAGVILPRHVIVLARKWWVDSQHDSQGDFGGYAARGWSYRGKGDFHAYGSMTAGALGGVCIYDFILDRKWKTDKVIVSGIAWVAKNFTVTENPGPPQRHGEGMNHYYYLYAVERLGMLYDSERLGGHEWYPEGARFLLGAQREDGSWKGDHEISDTCYAILFLRRATRRLDVASIDRHGRR